MAKSEPTLAEVSKKLTQFKTWLSDRGAELLAPTSEYELVRFRIDGKTTVIYRKKEPNSKVSFFCDKGQEAWEEFTKGVSNWRAMPATVRQKGYSWVLKRTLRQRDGDECFYCAERMQDRDMTIEHLVSLCHGGPEHISNKFLAHTLCNQRAGNLSAVEKLKIYHFARVKKALEQKNVGQLDCGTGVAHNDQAGEATGELDEQPRAHAQPA
jgi:5-methylcytosine-specific restriction endonuclease McrA